MGRSDFLGGAVGGRELTRDELSMGHPLARADDLDAEDRIGDGFNSDRHSEGTEPSKLETHSLVAIRVLNSGVTLGGKGGPFSTGNL